jgi:hypothetical protein
MSRKGKISWGPNKPVEPVKVIFSSMQRDNCEKAYGHTIPVKLWSAIEKHTSDHITLARTNKVAVRIPPKEIRDALGRAVSAVRELRGEEQPEPLQLDAAWIHRKYFQDTTQFIGSYDIWPLLDIATDAFLAVATLVETKMAELEQQPQPRWLKEGYAWCFWSFGLGQELEDHGLPSAIRKDADKRKPGQLHSPFVLFVEELQKYLPSDFTRGGVKSTDALAQGLYRARKYCEAFIQSESPLVRILPDGQKEVVEWPRGIAYEGDC